jgi:hypothetical protein
MTPPPGPLIFATEPSAPGRSIGARYRGSGSFPSILLVLACIGLMALPGTLAVPAAQAPTPASAPLATALPSAGAAMLLAAQASLDHHEGPAAMPHPAGPFSNWTDITPPNGSAVPEARQLAAMAYDPVDQYVVLFGGGNVNPTGQYNDTWTFVNGTWTGLSTPVAPAIRRSATFGWDAADGYLLLFGGLNPGGSLSSSNEYQDTWSFLHGIWTDRTASSINANNTPSARWNAQMAYDPGRSAVILFGGCYQLACAASTNDTWSYQRGNWTNITSTVGGAPSDRGTASMVWYPPDAALFLFGGSTPNQTVLGDTWELGATGWTQLAPPTTPSPRGDYWMTYDNGTQQIVLFGGLAYSISPNAYALGDTWTFYAGNWTNETAVDSYAPPALWGEQFAGAWDGRDNCGILFGGADSNDNNLDATWGYDCPFGSIGSSGSGGGNGTGGNYTGNDWSQVNTVNGSTPTGRQLASMAYDPTDGYVVLFGGGDGSSPGQQFNDTWTFANGSWTQLFPSVAPPARRSASMVWDASDGYLVLFGGIYPGYASYQDTWNFLHGIWQDRTPSSINATNTPSVRWNAQMGYDPTLGKVVLFGGCNALACASSTHDTWAYHAGNWTNITGAVGSPPADRGTANLVWYPPDHALLLFGGSTPNQTVLGDTWELGSRGWTQLFPATSPSSRGDYWMIYDNASGAMVLFGGLRYSMSPNAYALGDTWIYQNGTWTNDTNPNASAPPALWGEQSAGAYDPVNTDGILFGGYTTSDYPLAGTWIYHAPNPGNGSGGSNGSGKGGGNGTGNNGTNNSGGSHSSGGSNNSSQGNSSGGSNNSGGSQNNSSGTPLGGGGTHVPPPEQPLIGTTSESTAVGTAPLSVEFVAAPSGGEAPYHYAWNFGDGVVGADSAIAHHTYTSVGTYQPVVTVTDQSGARVTWLLPEIVIAPGAKGTSGPAPLFPNFPPTLWLGTGLVLAVAVIGASLFARRRWTERLRQEGEELLAPIDRP